MKLLILNLITLTAILTPTANCATIAKIQTPLTRYESTAREIRVLYHGLRIGEVVSELNTSMTARYKEVRTQEGGTSTSAYANASSQSNSDLTSNFFGHWGRWHGGENNQTTAWAEAHAFTTDESSWDLTEFVLENPREVDGFNRQVTDDAAQIRENLLRYLNQHETEIIRFKEFGILNLAAAFELIKVGQKISDAEIASTVRLLGELNFLGSQQITTCVKARYIDRDWTNTVSSGANAHAYLLSQEQTERRHGAENETLESRSDADTGVSSKSYWRQIAHTEKTCDSSLNTVDVTQADAVYSVSLSRLDDLLVQWTQAIDALKITSPGAQPLFPTFGSPYYR